ncbi:hypothetical protein [Fannyhessea vaginae]|uniref:hypothetical protein n=1 Tax=Fannyhessea vaginae TaxID=82135 RepID=UPI0023F40574|nr:hypothetical protein [Fannyhessea vaginae]
MDTKETVYIDVDRTQFVGKDKPAKELISSHTQKNTGKEFWKVTLPYGTKCIACGPYSDIATEQDVSGYSFITNFEPRESHSSYESYRAKHATVSFPKDWTITLQKSVKEGEGFITYELTTTPSALAQAYKNLRAARLERMKQKQQSQGLQGELDSAARAAARQGTQAHNNAVPTCTFDMRETSSRSL